MEFQKEQFYGQNHLFILLIKHMMTQGKFTTGAGEREKNQLCMIQEKGLW